MFVLLGSPSAKERAPVAKTAVPGNCQISVANYASEVEFCFSLVKIEKGRLAFCQDGELRFSGPCENCLAVLQIASSLKAVAKFYLLAGR